MSKELSKAKLLLMVMTVAGMFATSGCIIYHKSEGTTVMSKPSQSCEFKTQRTVSMSKQNKAGYTKFTLETENGSVDVVPGASGQCDIIAKITARASSAEESKRLAQEVKISLDVDEDNAISVNIDRPNCQSSKVTVDITAVVDGDAELSIMSGNGDVNILENQAIPKPPANKLSASSCYAQ